MERIERQILQFIEKNVSIYELIDHQDASIPEFFKLINKMQKDGILEINNGKVKITDKGKNIKKKHLLRRIDTKCEYCDGKGYNMNSLFRNILDQYLKIVKDRPKTIEVYDQGFMSPEDVIRRLEFIYERGDLPSHIFIIGDDDLFSIAAGLTGIPEKITVLEIDERIVDFINKRADELGLNIEAYVYDVQRDLPKYLRSKYDIFVTDPVETLPGLNLFLSRGISALKGVGSSCYFGLTTLEASREKWYKLQEMIHRMGFVITDIKRKFSVYPEDEKNFFRFQDKLPIVKKLRIPIDWNWYTSSFFRIEAVRKPNPLVEGDMIVDDKIYRDEESWATPY
jgi:hypothetical protein